MNTFRVEELAEELADARLDEEDGLVRLGAQVEDTVVEASGLPHLDILGCCTLLLLQRLDLFLVFLGICCLDKVESEGGLVGPVPGQGGSIGRGVMVWWWEGGYLLRSAF